MPDSLKGENTRRLLTVIAGNLAAFYVLLLGEAVRISDLASLDYRIDDAIPAGLGLAVISVLNAQLSADAKARIVFLRWNNPLPGSRAFSSLAASDSRVDMVALRRSHGPLPSDPRQKNGLWYKLYKSVDTVPGVHQAHREYLFTRDYASLALMIAPLLGIVGYMQVASIMSVVVYVGVLVAQYVLASRAARTHGRRLVTTVLAVKSAEPQVATIEL